MLSVLGGVAVVAAGFVAGAVNAIVGSGSLVTFPTLLALGYPPVLANVSNNIGLVPGSASGAFGYRRELTGQRSRMVRLGVTSSLGGLTGGILLLELPAKAFRSIVPVLILVACVLVVVQPRLSAWLARQRPHPTGGGPLLVLGVYLTGIYGGYFGAAQGVLLLALLGIFLDDDLQRLNGLKNVLAGLVNGVAAVLFIIVAHVAWVPVLLLAVGSTVGGQVGAGIGRRLPAIVLRVAIVVVGVTVAVVLLVT